jgi:TetR/AcrR family hemagglutinin/protease transcriptional regulator
MATGTARSRARRRLRPTDRRAELLAQALAVFAHRGIGRGGHAEIAKRSGVAVSTVFVYFPSRNALVDAVLDEVARFLTVMAQEIHGRGRPATDALYEHVVTFTNSVESHPDHARVWLDWSTAVRERIWVRYLRLQERVVGIIAATIARGQREGSIAKQVDADDVALLLVGSAHLLAQLKFSGQPQERIDRFIRVLLGAALGRTPQS